MLILTRGTVSCEENLQNLLDFLKLFFLIFTVLVRQGKKGEAEIVLLDHGLYEELPLKVRQSLCQLWSSIVRNDHYGMKQHAAELGVNG